MLQVVPIEGYDRQGLACAFGPAAFVKQKLNLTAEIGAKS